MEKMLAFLEKREYNGYMSVWRSKCGTPGRAKRSRFLNLCAEFQPIRGGGV